MVTGTNKREFTHTAFNPADTLHYHLSVETGDDFLCCAVHDAKSGELLAVDTEKPDYLDRRFDSVSCAVVNSYFTLIPDDIYEESERQSYLTLNVQMPTGFSVHSHKIAVLNTWCIYAVDKLFEEKLEKKFPSVLMRHIISVAVESLQPVLNTNTVMAQLVVFKNYFVLIISDHGKIKFCNIFKWNVHEDLAYYLHFALEQLTMSVQDTEVRISGPMYHSVMEDYLKKFFRIAKDNSNETDKRFYTLIHQLACV